MENSRSEKRPLCGIMMLFVPYRVKFSGNGAYVKFYSTIALRFILPPEAPAN